MDITLTKDARGLVDGVVTYLRHENRAGAMAPKVKTFLNSLTSQAKKEKTAKIESSIVLTASEKHAIGEFLSELLEHDIELECSVNPEVLAGLRIQVGDWIVDTTLKDQLERMAAVLMR